MALGLLGTTACATNPVTGEQEFSLISTEAEISAGEEHYLPMQQISGGLYTVDPALAAYVTEVGQRLMAVSDRRLPYEFVVLNSSIPNAWALPGGKIAITRGLLVELDNEAELAAVLGHEVVHAAARHGTHSMQRELLSQLVMLGAAVALKDSDSANYALGAGSVGLQLINRSYSREAEREADYYGMKYMQAAGYDPAAAVTLQEKFVALAEGGETGWLEGLFASHPASSERVESNRVALAEFRAGGELGRSDYAERVIVLRDRKGAYEEADRARMLLRQSPGEALQVIDDAIRREPREPLFHGIKGQVLASQGQYEEALRAYDAAVERDSGYFGHYLGRGLVHDTLGHSELARRDLERSNSLLRTAAASYVLGGIALKGGERAKAKRLYRAASGAGGTIGADAREAYVKLDIVDAPGRYVTTEAFFAGGQVVVNVLNSTGYELRDVIVRIDVASNGTRLSPQRHQIARLPANAFTLVRTGIHVGVEDTAEVETHILQVGAFP